MSTLVERSINRSKRANRQDIRRASTEIVDLAFILDAELGELGVAALSQDERQRLSEALIEDPTLIRWIFARNDSKFRH